MHKKFLIALSITDDAYPSQPFCRKLYSHQKQRYSLSMSMHLIFVFAIIIGSLIVADLLAMFKEKVEEKGSFGDIFRCKL
jgi:hypothetical protein